MSEHEQTLKDDVAFLRALAVGGASVAAKDGAVLVAVGVIFGLVSVQYWAIDAGLIQAGAAVRTWLWLDGFIPFLLALVVIGARYRDRPVGAASRALAAIWSGLGTAFVAAIVALYAASRGLNLPLLVKWTFPLVLFVLLGAAWAVAFAVRRQALFGAVAAGAFAAAILVGVTIGRPDEWLVLAAGLLVLVAVPGVSILRGAERRR